jgi:MFS transporter, putative metabolite:H+ symporter
MAGQWLLLTGYFWSIGTVLTPALAYLGLQEEGSWRVFVLLCSIPCLISTVLAVFWVPESPRWLAANGREAQALVILRKAAQQNGKDPLATFPPDVQLVQDPNEETMHSIACLFKKQWRWLTINIWAVWLGKSFMYMGTVQLVTLVFSSENPAEDMANSFDYAAILAASAAEIVGQTIAMGMVERGRKLPQAMLYVLTGLFSVGLCLLAANVSTGRGVLILFACLARMFSNGATSLTWVITAEILPTQIRNTGHSWAAAVGKIGGALSPWIISNQNSFQTIAIVYAAVTVWISTAVCLLPETSGRALGTAGSSSFLESDTSKATEMV